MNAKKILEELRGDEYPGCCEPFKIAQRLGSDNEGYGSVIVGDPGEYYFASSGDADLPVIKLCPWCGTKVG